MEAPNHETRDADDLRADVFEAAADALEDYSHDSTGGLGYNRRRAYDRGFSAAMSELRDVPLEDRPDDLVSEVDELVAIVRDSDSYIDGAVEALREAAEEARTGRVFPDIGDTVRVTYDSPQSDTPCEKTGTVLSVSDSGTIRFWVGDDPERHHKVSQRRDRLTSVGYGPTKFGPWRHLAELGTAEAVEVLD